MSEYGHLEPPAVVTLGMVPNEFQLSQKCYYFKLSNKSPYHIAVRMDWNTAVLDADPHFIIEPYSVQVVDVKRGTERLSYVTTKRYPTAANPNGSQELFYFQGTIDPIRSSPAFAAVGLSDAIQAGSTTVENVVNVPTPSVINQVPTPGVVNNVPTPSVVNNVPTPSVVNQVPTPSVVNNVPVPGVTNQNNNTVNVPQQPVTTPILKSSDQQDGTKVLQLRSATDSQDTYQIDNNGNVYSGPGGTTAPTQEQRHPNATTLELLKTLLLPAADPLSPDGAVRRGYVDAGLAPRTFWRDNTFTAASLPSAFLVGTTMTLANAVAQGWPGSNGIGGAVTVKHSSTNGYTYQEFYERGTELVRRRYATDTGDAWGAWEVVASRTWVSSNFATIPTVNAKQNSSDYTLTTGSIVASTGSSTTAHGLGTTNLRCIAQLWTTAAPGMVHAYPSRDIACVIRWDATNLYIFNQHTAAIAVRATLIRN